MGIEPQRSTVIEIELGYDVLMRYATRRPFARRPSRHVLEIVAQDRLVNAVLDDQA